MYDYSVPVAVAAVYSEFPIPIWFKWIRRGWISASPPLPDGKLDSQIAQFICIPLRALPRSAATHYLQEYLLKDSFFSFDFIFILDRRGKPGLHLVLKDLALVKQMNRVRSEHPLDATAHLSELSVLFRCSLSTLYRKEHILMNSELRKLIEASNLSEVSASSSFHSHSLCLLAGDYLTDHFVQPNHPSQNQLLVMLQEEADSQGPRICNRCPYNPNTKARKKTANWHLPECTFSHTGGMIVPSNRHSVNRFLAASISAQESCYFRKGFNAWSDQFVHKTKRIKPNTVNAVWYGDHHLVDCVVIVGHDRQTKEPVLARPWLTVITDAASDAIVGSVVTLRPNSETIAECFCRAAAFTVDSPFYGLPEVFYVDRGMDYRSKLLEVCDPDMHSHELGENSCFNRAFCENPLLQALNVIVHHALPRTGRSKVIERVFGTLTRTFFREIPGWTGNHPKNRPFDFEKEKKRLLKKGELWTLEKFARYWFEEIVPAYNDMKPDKQEYSHLELYQSLPRAKTLVPDWNSLAVFKVAKPQHKVHPDGIHYRKEVYWNPALRPLIGEKVHIYDFDQTFCHSLTVLYHGKYICEAEPLVYTDVVESDRLKLAQHLEEQKAHKRLISRRVTRLRKVLKLAHVSTQRYVQYDPEPFIPDAISDTAVSDEIVIPSYAEEIDIVRDKTDATVLSETANEIGRTVRAQTQAIEHIINGKPDTPLSDFFEKLGAEPK